MSVVFALNRINFSLQYPSHEFWLYTGLASYVIIYLKQMAKLAILCVQYEADYRPNKKMVAEALQSLLNDLTG